MKPELRRNGTELTVLAENPDLPSRRFGVVLALAGLFMLVGFHLSGAATNEYSYRFGQVGPVFRWVTTGLATLISLALILGGSALALIRSGTTIDQAKQRVDCWTRLHGERSVQSYALSDFDQVELRRHTGNPPNIRAVGLFLVGSKPGEILLIRGHPAYLLEIEWIARSLARELSMPLVETNHE